MRTLTPCLVLAGLVLASCGDATLEVKHSGSTASVTSGEPKSATSNASTAHTPSSEVLGDAGTTPPKSECAPGQTKLCQTACASTGIVSCTSESLWSSTCTPGNEQCGNGVDDDCNGLTDAADPACKACAQGQTRTCTSACGSVGTQSCEVNGQWSVGCAPGVEACGNGTDDDCDGFVDTGDSDCRVCTPGQTRVCSSSCGTTGLETCAGAGQWGGSCGAPKELCGNGIDDDCDGKVDAADPECWVCTPGQSRTCTTSCGSHGTQGCGVDGAWAPTCTKPSESCNNGIDDDCDGKVDSSDPECPPRVETCDQVDGNCNNGDMGYGDHCGAADNTAHCSSSRFWAWCNRRNPAYPNQWDNWIHDWVASRCDGVTTENGQQYNTFSCLSSTNTLYQCTTPLVLVFDVGAKVTFAAAPASFAFTPGAPVASDWPTDVTPWLVRDVNGNGRIDDGTELFGSDTRVGPGRAAVNGFEALAALDANHDGRLDAKDPAWKTLQLWRDRNADKRSTPGELTSLAASGVTSLSVGYAVEPRCDAHGNCERERSTFTFTASDGSVRTGALVDVWLKTKAAPVLVCER